MKTNRKQEIIRVKAFIYGMFENSNESVLKILYLLKLSWLHCYIVVLNKVYKILFVFI